MSSEGWTPCSVASVIKTGFRSRIQMLLDNALEIALFSWWEGTFPGFDHKEVYLFQTESTGFFIFCGKNTA